MTQKYTFSDGKSKVILSFLLQPIVNTILKTINAYECLSQIENITANKHYDKSTFFDNLDKNILKDIIIKQIIEINGNTNLIRSKKNIYKHTCITVIRYRIPKQNSNTIFFYFSY
ncbi:hypothetical protein UB40_18680 [Photobacterium kishitanii]|uniref:hypothetical protein n=1 Tax=Photobacterium kishitanii TaxID=318456 RepID=UPI0005D33AF7|nr:hypothetical protein [Photobacterium kishitanii]KJG08335.1 hypothetical protein UB40_18680 [Photobacterium kishitanii]